MIQSYEDKIHDNESQESVKVRHIFKHNRSLKVAVQGLDFMAHSLYIHT
jgi:hypothetical protein